MRTAPDAEEDMMRTKHSSSPAGHAGHRHGGTDHARLQAMQSEAERAAVLAELEEDEDDVRARLHSDGLTGWEMAVLAELDAVEERLSA